MTITCLPLLWVTLVVASTNIHSSEQDEEQKALIQNKNINVIVNVNAQEVAQELWKIIETRLNNRTNHITSSKSIQKDLEKAIVPLISHSRRDNTSPSAFQVATQLDEITRRAITRDTPSINMLDQEITTRDIVADMMAYLKMTISKQTYLKTIKKDSRSRRMMHHPFSTTMSDDDENDYVNVRIKIHRKDILNIVH